MNRNGFHGVVVGSLADRAVVMVHPFPLHAGTWVDVGNALPKGWCLVAPHLPGFGTAPPATDGVLTMERAASVVVEGMDALGIRRAVLGGMSMGGYVAMAAWRMDPSRFEAVVLAGTKAVADNDTQRAGREAMAVRALAEGPGFLVTEMLPRLLRRSPDASVVGRCRVMMEAASGGAVAAAQRGMAVRPDSMETLASMHVPALVMVGDEDVITPREEAERMVHALPNGRMEVLANAGHLAHLDAPEAFHAALGAFLRTLS